MLIKWLPLYFIFSSVTEAILLSLLQEIQSAECFDGGVLKIQLYHLCFVFESTPLLKNLPLWGNEMTWTFGFTTGKPSMVMLGNVIVASVNGFHQFWPLAEFLLNICPHDVNFDSLYDLPAARISLISVCWKKGSSAVFLLCM